MKTTLESVSEEAMYIKGWFVKRPVKVVIQETFKELTTKYPDIPVFWLHSGILKSGGGGGDINDAISDLEKCLEVNPNSYGANAYLMAKHMVVGTLGRMLPVEERNLETAKMYIDRMIQIDPNNPYGPTYAGNYERAKGNFEQAGLSIMSRLEIYHLKTISMFISKPLPCINKYFS